MQNILQSLLQIEQSKRSIDCFHSTNIISVFLHHFAYSELHNLKSHHKTHTHTHTHTHTFAQTCLLFVQTI
jgi:hypothetical protein